MNFHSSARLGFLSAGAAIVLLGCGSPASSPGSTTMVAWSNSPGVDARSAGSVQAARACAASDLVATPGASGAYQGYATQEIQLKNRASDSCFLSGAPAMDLTSNGSGRDHVDGAAFKVTRVDLDPGRSASVLLGAPGACAAAGS